MFFFFQNQPGPRDDRDADCDDDLSDEDDEAAKAKGEEMPPLIGGHGKCMVVLFLSIWIVLNSSGILMAAVGSFMYCQHF